MNQAPTGKIVAQKGQSLVLIRDPAGQFTLLDRETQHSRPVPNPQSVLKTGYWEILDPAAIQTPAPGAQ